MLSFWNLPQLQYLNMITFKLNEIQYGGAT